MYSKRAGLILGFHGCDKSVRDKVVAKRDANLKSSKTIAYVCLKISRKDFRKEGF